MNKVTTIAAALLMGFTFSAIAGTPKEDTKTEAKEAKTESPAENKSNDDASLHWYVVSYETNPFGVVQSAASFYDEGERETIVSPCSEGNNRDCLRGFSAPLTSFPNNNPGTDQIKRVD